MEKATTGFMQHWYEAVLARGMSQRQVAEAIRRLAEEHGDEAYLRFHQTRVSKWLNGEGTPDVDDLRYLAAVAGRTASDLVYFEGHPGPDEPRPAGDEAAELPEGWGRLAKLVRAVGGPEAAEDALIDVLAGGGDIPGRPEPEGPPAIKPRRGRPPGSGRRG